MSQCRTITPLPEWPKLETDNTSVAKDVKQLVLFCFAGGNINCFSHFGKLSIAVTAKHSPTL